MTSPVERLWEFCCDINQNEVNDHIIVNGSGGVATVGIDTEWLDGWHRAVDKLIGDIRDGYMELPLDTDGIPIRVGDELDGYGKTITVASMRYESFGWVLISDEGGGFHDCYAFTHHHEPTVEDVLRDFAKAWDEWKDGSPYYPFTEYAAKLRLAGDGND